LLVRKRFEKLYILFEGYLSTVILTGILIILPFTLPYTALANEVLIFSLVAVSFDLCLGYTGIMMFCQAAIWGTGLYATALTLLHFTQNIFAAIFFGVLSATILAVIVGAIATKRAHTYMVLITMAFSELIYFIAYQWDDVTGGSDGLTGIPRPNLEIPGIISIDLQAQLNYYFFILFFFLLSFIIIKRITISPFGRILQGIRENEARAQSIGYNTRIYKIVVFGIAGMFMGLSGSLYVMLVRYAHISNVGIDISGNIIMMELIGGMGTLFGPILGAFLFTITADIASAYWDRWLIILGVICIVFVLFARGGIWVLMRDLGKRFFNVHPPQRKTTATFYGDKLEKSTGGQI